MNAITEIQPPSPSNGLSALMLELAKSLKLVAPITMSADAQMVWLQAAADALDGIRSEEVHAISAELRRSVTRPAQIVPEIARLVSEKRGRASQSHKPASPFMAERAITLKGQELRASARTQRQINDAHDWERNARVNAGLAVQPVERPLSRAELRSMPAHVQRLGLQSGFLKHDGDSVIEVMSPEETDRIREENRRK